MIQWFTNKSYGTACLSIYIYKKIKFGCLSVKASEMFGENIKAILLGYDNEQKIIAIKPVDINVKGRKKVTFKNKKYQFSVHGFVNFFNLDLSKNTKLPVEKKDDMLIAKLDSNS